jgi:small subunit ribosomal protein S8
MMTDPIADMLTRIRNAGEARHVEATCPSSKLKLAIARVLEQEGFLGSVRVEARAGHPVLVMQIRYDETGTALIDGIRRVSKPGRRVYAARGELPKVRSGLGVAVLSTSRGVLSDRAAREARVGGEIVCEVW